MSMLNLTPSIRLRRTPFSNRVDSAGAKAYTIYNHMRLASYYETPEEDYRHLKTAVQVWDVSCERQVEIKGPDALRLAPAAVAPNRGRVPSSASLKLTHYGVGGTAASASSRIRAHTLGDAA